tara:strand:+ start:254 stop:400 length:147 start_codon:yes stop_codon:yes gene_type:complete
MSIPTADIVIALQYDAIKGWAWGGGELRVVWREGGRWGFGLLGFVRMR